MNANSLQINLICVNLRLKKGGGTADFLQINLICG